MKGYLNIFTLTFDVKSIETDLTKSEKIHLYFSFSISVTVSDYGLYSQTYEHSTESIIGQVSSRYWIPIAMYSWIHCYITLLL